MPLPQSRARGHTLNRRRLLLARTALCGALGGVGAFTANGAWALPVGGISEVSAGGGVPVVTETAGRTDIRLNATRTVIAWNSYNLKPDETVTYNFSSRSGIVLNRIVGLQDSKIEGTIEGRVGSAYGGNIWFVSQNNIIIGRGARIDAGGLFFGIGTPDIPAFLDPTNTLFKFDGGDALPGSRLWVLANAQVAGHGGMVAFAGPTIVTRANAVVTSDGNDVLYGSAKTFSIRLAPGAGGDFDLIDFLVPNVAAGSEGRIAVDLAGETKANSVFVAAVSKSALGSAVINLEGLVTAAAAKADGGDIVLSGGGGIVARAPGPSLSGAAPTDIYLNRATAGRDLNVRNVGKIFARPWVRPPEEFKDPTTIQQDETAIDTAGNGFGNGNGSGNGFGNGNGNGFGGNGFGPSFAVQEAELLSSLFDPVFISTVSAGRDARIQATASIELGRIVAGRDIAVDGRDVKANSLIATGNLNVNATAGAVALAGVSVGRDGVVTGTGDVSIDSISAPQKLAVTSGGSITVGDGRSAVAGVISLTAAGAVTLDLASAKIDTVSAGSIANIRGGALDIGTVTAPRFFAQAASLKIGTATSSGDIYVLATSGDAIVGNATSGDDIYVIATHGAASLTNGTLTGAGPDIVGAPFSGNPDAVGNGRVVIVQSTDLDARLGLGTGGVTGATNLQVLGGRDATVDVLKPTPGVFRVNAARDATLRAPTVTLDAVTSGRDLALGSTTGDFILTSTLSATRNLTVSAAGALRLGDVRADAGSVTLTGATVQAGAVSASEDLILRALTGGVTTTSYKVGRDLIIQGASLSLGSAITPVVRDLSITALGGFSSTGALAAGRNLTLDVTGKATLGPISAGQNIRILAADLDLTGAAIAPAAQIESRTGGLRVGGASGDVAGMFSLDGAEFGQLRISGPLRIFAGSSTGVVRGDLNLQALTINPAQTPNVAFLVGSSNTARVTGTVAPTVNGGILRIGDASDLAWRPGSILVTGSLGAATFSGGPYTNVRAFDEVRLAARQDILFGSDRFIALVQSTPIADIDVANGKPAGVAPVGAEQFRVFAATGKLEVSADNKVVQQNTAPAGSAQPSGLFLTGAFNPALIIDPPLIVELYGVVGGTDGKVLGGAAAGGALTFTVVDATGAPTSRPSGAAYRFNSCDVGTGDCTFSAPSDTVVSQNNAGVLAARDQLSHTFGHGGGRPPKPESRTSEEAGQDAVSAAESLTAPPVLLALAAADSDEIVTDPVTAGAGSEEIWRKRRQKNNGK